MLNGLSLVCLMSSIATASANPWVRILDALEKKINRHSYDTWLKPTRFSHSEGAILFVRVPTPEFRHIGEKYADLIQEAIEVLNLEFNDVEFVTTEDASDKAANGAGVRGFPPASAGAASARTAQSRFDWDSAAQLNPR